MALALPTGLLFGLGYGTGVRIGYEQLYPLLFPDKLPRNPEQVREAIIGINKTYNAIGGKEASQMGMGMGVQAAGELLDNPDFQVLEELESRLSGRTPGKSDPHEKSDKNSLEDSSKPGKYSFEWIQDFISRIPLATRAQLIIWRQYLESNPTEKLDQQDIDNLLAMVVGQLDVSTTEDPGTTHSAKFKAQFKAMLTQLDKEELENMFTNRAKFFNWQIQMITQERQSREENFQQLTDYQARRKAYTDEIARLQGHASNFKKSYHQAVKKLNKVNMAKQLKANLAIVKRIINYITLSRNDLTLKSLANNDWNKRIWKINRIVV